jgi:hypothetical protein
VLSAFMIDCQCGEQLLLGDASGVTRPEEIEAWHGALGRAARSLAVPLVWAQDPGSCPQCGALLSYAASARG